MLRYIIKRIIFAIPVLIGATFLVFTIMDLAPGDPARIILGSNATEAALASLRDSMGLNDPFLVRYGRFILGLLHGDLGTSYRNGQAVFSLIMGRLGNTVVLATSGIVFSVIIGIPVGIISAIKQYSVLDNITMFITLFLMAVPTFWFALILVIIFFTEPGLAAVFRHAARIPGQSYQPDSAYPDPGMRICGSDCPHHPFLGSGGGASGLH